jgi:Lar family restriction alleviation protein
MSDMKTCPFCGGDAVMETFRTARENFQRYRVRCSKCWCETDWESTSADDATEKWNRRADE